MAERRSVRVVFCPVSSTVGPERDVSGIHRATRGGRTRSVGDIDRQIAAVLCVDMVWRRLAGASCRYTLGAHDQARTRACFDRVDTGSQLHFDRQS